MRQLNLAVALFAVANESRVREWLDEVRLRLLACYRGVLVKDAEAVELNVDFVGRADDKLLVLGSEIEEILEEAGEHRIDAHVRQVSAFERLFVHTSANRTQYMRFLVLVYGLVQLLLISLLQLLHLLLVLLDLTSSVLLKRLLCLIQLCK